MMFENINPSHRIQGKLFGLPIPPEKAAIVVLPAPWSVSYPDAGTLLGPESLLIQSCSLGLHEERYPEAWRLGMTMLPMPNGWKLKSNQLNHSARTYLQAREAGSAIVNYALTTRIDQYTLAFKERIKSKALISMNQGKMVSLVGGEHTCALGLIEACAQVHDTFGILHIDAHADLSKSHHGLIYSHASVMYHALQIAEVKRIVQVGLRSYQQEDALVISESKDRIISFTDEALKKALYKGDTWHHLSQAIVSQLPHKVYISLDVDALSPPLCPSTPRPVPGGIDTSQLLHLLDTLVEAGKEIIAFDISEVASNGETAIDGLVASYLLYKMGLCMGVSQGKL